MKNPLHYPRRPDLKRFSRAFGSIVSIAVIVAAGCTSSGPAGSPSGSTSGGDNGPKRGGTFVDSALSDPKMVNPYIGCCDSTNTAFAGLQYDAPLIRLNENTLDYETKYGTAESYQIAADGLSVSFKLKDNIFWSDGRPIVADDYKFTLERFLLDPKVEFAARANYSQIDSASAPDPKTFIVKLKEVSCPILSRLGFAPMPKHVFESLDLNDNPELSKPTVGSGPWLLQEWVKGDHATFVANEKFFLGRPNLDKYVYRIVPDTNVQYSMLKNGELDLGSIRGENWDEAKSVSGLQTLNYYRAAGSYEFLGFWFKNELVKDIKVREAIARSINRQQIIDRVRFGHAKPLDSMMVSTSWAYTNDTPKFSYDVSKAKQLLDEAGWKAPANDPNGIRVKDGKPFKARVFYNAGNKDREQIATVIQGYLKAVGLDSDVVSEEFTAYLNRITKTHDVEMYVLGWNTTVEPHSQQSIWSTDGGQNTTGLAISQVDTLFQKAASLPGCDQNERKNMYVQIQKLVTQEVPYVFLYEAESLAGISDRIVVNKLTPLGFGYRPWEWYSKNGK